MTTIIHTSTPAQFLALVPHLAGYVPQQSVAFVPFHGTRTLGLLRFDLPYGDVDAFAATAVGTICRLEEADGIAIVVYTDAQLTPALPYVDLVAALRSRADACGVQVVDALAHGANGWASYADANVRPLSELAHQATASLPPLASHQRAGADLPAITGARRDEVRMFLTTTDDTVRTYLTHPGEAPDPAATRVATMQLFDEVLSVAAEELSAEDCALLISCLYRPILRDVALATWCHGVDAGSNALAAQLRWRDGLGLTATEAQFLAGEGPRPASERLLRALRLTRLLAALTDGEHRAAALATSAWLSWALGLGTQAERLASDALSLDPLLGLAEIITSLTRAGRLPDWAFRPRAAVTSAGTSAE